MKIISGGDLNPRHFAWGVVEKVATITINRPDRKNPLTFDSYAELRDTFQTLKHVDDIKTIVITGAGGFIGWNLYQKFKHLRDLVLVDFVDKF